MTAIKYPLSTEKSIRMMEAENKLTFIVDRNATKQAIKKETEEMFKVKIESVRTHVMPDGRKKAFVKISKEFPAIDVATQLGLI